MREGWRIVREEHVRSGFSGEGAAKFGGRWNSRGVRMVYASASVSLATLETLVHLNPRESYRYKLFHLEFDETLLRFHEGVLPEDWRIEPPPTSTRIIGDQWVRGLLSPILCVPSVIVPQENNLLLNPDHPDFKRIRIGKPLAFAFDPRLI